MIGYICLNLEDAECAELKGMVSPDLFDKPYVPLSQTQDQAVNKAIWTPTVTTAVEAATQTTRWVLLVVTIPHDQINEYFWAHILKWEYYGRDLHFWAPLRLRTGEILPHEAWKPPPRGVAALRLETVWQEIAVPPLGLDAWANHVLTWYYNLPVTAETANDVCRGCGHMGRLWTSTHDFQRQPFCAECWKQFILLEGGIGSSLHQMRDRRRALRLLRGR